MQLRVSILPWCTTFASKSRSLAIDCRCHETERVMIPRPQGGDGPPLVPQIHTPQRGGPLALVSSCSSVIVELRSVGHSDTDYDVLLVGQYEWCPCRSLTSGRSEGPPRPRPRPRSFLQLVGSFFICHSREVVNVRKRNPSPISRS